MFHKKFHFSFFFLILTSCSLVNSSNSDSNTNLLYLALAASVNPNCAISSEPSIQSNLSQVESKKRTKYTISDCDDTGFENLALNKIEITKGAIGTSASSVIYTNKDLMYPISKGGTNIEVTFTLDTPTSSLDIIAYGSENPMSGPTYRIIAGAQTQYKNSSNVFSNTSKGGSVSAPIPILGKKNTFCLDFQNTLTSSRYLNGFDKPCSELSLTERGSMAYYPIMQMMGVPSYSNGNRLGFVLNGVTLTSFTIGSIISNTEM